MFVKYSFLIVGQRANNYYWVYPLPVSNMIMLMFLKN